MLRYKNYVLLRGIFRIRKYKSFFVNVQHNTFGKLNKLAAQHLTKQQRINNLRKPMHAKYHKKT